MRVKLLDLHNKSNRKNVKLFNMKYHINDEDNTCWKEWYLDKKASHLNKKAYELSARRQNTRTAIESKIDEILKELGDMLSREELRYESV